MAGVRGIPALSLLSKIFVVNELPLIAKGNPAYCRGYRGSTPILLLPALSLVSCLISYLLPTLLAWRVVVLLVWLAWVCVGVRCVSIFVFGSANVGGFLLPAKKIFLLFSGRSYPSFLLLFTGNIGLRSPPLPAPSTTVTKISFSALSWLLSPFLFLPPYCPFPKAGCKHTTTNHYYPNLFSKTSTQFIPLYQKPKN
jgi:hypothetical protein